MLKIANSIWYRQEFSFEPAFIEVNQTFFDATVEALDFSDPDAKNTINQWVKENTNGKIEEIVDQIDPEIVMFLINAIYFDGKWTYKFDKDQTETAAFTRADSTQKSVQMMHVTGDFQYFENELFQAVDLPYGAEFYSMAVLLPKPGVGADAVIAEFNQENWMAWTGSFDTRPVELALPKFKLEFETGLQEVLTALGMGVAFAQANANFRAMYAGPENVYIDKVKHKTFVEVTEDGTEAAAVTSVEIGVTSVQPPVAMRVDRPFVFVIRENHSGTLLFMGKLIDP